MYSKVISSAVCGVDGMLIGVEADVSDGLPTFTMVGYLSSSVKEAGERVRTALKNSGCYLPPKRITINLFPADVRKAGTGFDLPVAVSVLLCMGLEAKMNLEKTVIIGELGLNGSVSGVPGILPMVYHCFSQGITNCIVPVDNVNEAALVKGMQVYGVRSLEETVALLQSEDKSLYRHERTENNFDTTPKYEIDFSEIKGQETLKRGMEIGAAGFHNVLMTGAAGAGKSMLAKRLPTIMPKLSFEESIEVTKLYSISGLLSDRHALITERPFRSPHHTISGHALIGGGVVPKPGEVSLAHNGVLFLDELPEFSKNVLEVMRQPMEDRCITISRLNFSYRFPADFMLVAAMNPCPCGHYPDMARCTCTPFQIKNYQSRISGPLLDRIDINMEVKPVLYEELFAKGQEESSKIIRERVEQAREIQEKRFREENITFNSQLEGQMVKKYITLGVAEEELLKNAFRKMELSARGTYRVLKLARTIADLAGKDRVESPELLEALFYRNSGSHKEGNCNV